MDIVIKTIIFTLMLNWCIAMQFLNQVAQDKTTKILSVTISLATGAAAALSLLL